MQLYFFAEENIFEEPAELEKDMRAGFRGLITFRSFYTSQLKKPVSLLPMNQFKDEVNPMMLSKNLLVKEMPEEGVKCTANFRGFLL
jgi:hypothetical protein